MRTTNTKSLDLLEILPGTVFFSQFMNNEAAGDAGGDDESHDIMSRDNGQIRFRSTAHVNWLRDINVPNPTAISWEGEVLQNIEKNAKGDVFIEYVNKKRKVTVSWQFLTQTEYDALLNYLRIDFTVSHQRFLYYKITTVNPNRALSRSDAPSGAELNHAVNNRRPQLDSMITYLDGKHVGNVKMYHEGDELLIGYGDISLTFIER